MNYPELHINEEKCVKCGLCVNDCIVHCLEQNEETKIPQFKKYKEGTCIKCQHCLAICPTGALSIWGKNPENSEQINQINSDELLNLIKSRRSIRAYKPENLDKDRLSKLKDMLKWAPTGVNFHKLHFSFIDDKEVLDDIRTNVTPRLIKFLDNTVVQTTMGHFAELKKPLENGQDVIFRGAPHMVVVSTPTNAPCHNIDPIIALSYFELYAQSLGVGTVWCGFADLCFRIFPDLCSYIGVPDGYKVSYAMLFGLPNVKYSRTTQPEDFEITSVPLGGLRKSNLFGNVKQFVKNFIR